MSVITSASRGGRDYSPRIQSSTVRYFLKPSREFKFFKTPKYLPFTQLIIKKYTMPLTVEFCSDKDFTLSLMDIIFDAFGGRSALMNAVHPENDTRAGREKAQKFLYLLSTNPGQLWLKVVESETGEIVGVSQWAVYKDEKPQLTVLTGPAMNWNTAEDQEWAQALYASLLENRLQYIGPDPGAVVCQLSISLKQDAAN